MTMATPAENWFTTPLGSALLRVESQAVAAAFEQVFGFQCLQIGCWGPPELFLEHARTQRRALIAVEADSGGSVRSRAAELAIQADSVDAVLLPHTLERSGGRIAHVTVLGDGAVVIAGEDVNDHPARSAQEACR